MYIPPLFKKHGVLGINARNLLYIKPHNVGKAIAFADDKMKTKAFLSTRGIPTAKVFAVIEHRRQLQNFDFLTLPSECVLKPNNGFGGEGILILKGRKRKQFLVQGKRPISDAELREHIEDILDGKFSVGNRPDSAFFEQILTPHPCFLPFRPAGLPDIRIIVFNLVPVMAMLRIPTAESEGKANVHLGGVGIGIDIGKGVTTYGTQYHTTVTELPHGTHVSGMQLPYWDEMLDIAAKIQHVTNIGYLAVDLTIDKDKGPVLLEVNARAGLMVQMANMAPLQSRLQRVAGLKVQKPHKGVQLAKELFGGSGEKQKKLEKPILGPEEVITIAGEDFTLEEVSGIAPEQEETVIASELLDELLERGAADATDTTEKIFRVKFTLHGKKIVAHVRRGNPLGALRVLVGRRDLDGFLIDPSKKSSTHNRAASVLKKDLRGVDRVLARIDKELPVLKYLKPANLDEERQRIAADKSYEPLFQMREIQVDMDEREEELLDISVDASPLGILLGKKREELLDRIALLRARGDSVAFTHASEKLFGAPTEDLLKRAQQHLDARIASTVQLGGPELQTEDVQILFEKILESYGLHEWSVVIRSAMVADCAVGGKKIFLKKGATFSEMHVHSLVAHEIETHVLTAENGDAQPYLLFRTGCANYLDTQEGLAIWNQVQVLPPHHEKCYAHAKNVLAIAYAKKHSFSETRSYLEHELGMSPEKAVIKAIDVKRGFTRTADPGAFTKGLAYFRGYTSIEQYLDGGGDMKKLYVGKIAIEDLPLLEQITDVRPPVLLPKFLREPIERPSMEAKAKQKRK